MSCRGGRTGAPSPPKSVRVPVRHGVPLRTPRGRGAGREALRLAVDRRRRGTTRASRPRLSARASALPAGIDEPRRSSRGSDAFSACVSDIYRYQVWWMLGGTAACSSPPPRSCSRIPLWITRRRHLQPLTREDAPAVDRRRSRELAAEQGLRAPRLSLEPARSVARRARVRPPGPVHGGAHGRLARQAGRPIRLPSARSSATSSHTSGTATSASRTSRSRSGTRSCSSPCCRSRSRCSTRGSHDLGASPGGWLVLAALVYLTRNAVLRSREVYADLRASVPDGPDGRCDAYWPDCRGRSRACSSQVRRVHPDPQKRLAAVDDPRPLFPLGAVVAFAAGLSSTIAYESVVQLLSTFVNEPLDLHSSPHSRLRRSSLGSWASPSGARRLRLSRRDGSPLRRGSTGWHWQRGSCSDQSSHSSGRSPRATPCCDTRQPGRCRLGGVAGPRDRAPARLDPDECFLVDSSPRRPALLLRGSGDPVHRGGGAHDLHGRVLCRS